MATNSIVSSLGKRLANFNGKAYTSQGIKAQCVWYVRGRSIEKLGVNTGITGNANVWYAKASAKKLPIGKSLKANSIACFNNGTYGHVIFIEEVIGSTVYYTEANANADNKLSTDDGIVKKLSKTAFSAKKGFQGCIYVGKLSKKVTTSTTPTATTSTTAKPVAVSYKAGSAFSVKDIPVYVSATSSSKVSTFTGTLYLYDGKYFSSKGRYRFTKDKAKVNKTPIGSCVTGFINKKDLT